MSVFRVVLSAISEFLAPDPTTMKHQARISLDRLLTLGIAFLAVAMTIGYQLLGRFGPRFFGDDT